MEAKYEAAREALERSVQIGRDHGFAGVEINALGYLSGLESELGNSERADELGQRSLELARQIGDRYREGSALMNMGLLKLDRYDYAAAEPLLAEAAQVWKASGDPRAANAVNLLALVALRTGDHRRACKLLHEAMLSARAGGLTASAYNLVSTAAELAEPCGDHERAARWTGFCEVLQAKTGTRIPAGEQAILDAQYARLKSAMGAEAFAQAFRQGELLDFDAAWNEAEAWLAEQAVRDAAEGAGNE